RGQGRADAALACTARPLLGAGPWRPGSAPGTPAPGECPHFCAGSGALSEGMGKAAAGQAEAVPERPHLDLRRASVRGSAAARSQQLSRAVPPCSSGSGLSREHLLQDAGSGWARALSATSACRSGVPTGEHQQCPHRALSGDTNYLKPYKQGSIDRSRGYRLTADGAGRGRTGQDGAGWGRMGEWPSGQDRAAGTRAAAVGPRRGTAGGSHRGGHPSPAAEPRVFSRNIRWNLRKSCQAYGYPNPKIRLQRRRSLCRFNRKPSSRSRVSVETALGLPRPPVAGLPAGPSLPPVSTRLPGPRPLAPTPGPAALCSGSPGGDARLPVGPGGQPPLPPAEQRGHVGAAWRACSKSALSDCGRLGSGAPATCRRPPDWLGGWAWLGQAPQVCRVEAAPRRGRARRAAGGAEGKSHSVRDGAQQGGPGRQEGGGSSAQLPAPATKGVGATRSAMMGDALRAAGAAGLRGRGALPRGAADRPAGPASARVGRVAAGPGRSTPPPGLSLGRRPSVGRGWMRARVRAEEPEGPGPGVPAAQRSPKLTGRAGREGRPYSGANAGGHGLKPHPRGRGQCLSQARRSWENAPSRRARLWNSRLGLGLCVPPARPFSFCGGPARLRGDRPAQRRAAECPQHVRGCTGGVQGADPEQLEHYLLGILLTGHKSNLMPRSSFLRQGVGRDLAGRLSARVPSAVPALCGALPPGSSFPRTPRAWAGRSTLTCTSGVLHAPRAAPTLALCPLVVCARWGPVGMAAGSSASALGSDGPVALQQALEWPRRLVLKSTSPGDGWGQHGGVSRARTPRSRREGESRGTRFVEPLAHMRPAPASRAEPSGAGDATAAGAGFARAACRPLREAWGHMQHRTRRPLLSLCRGWHGVGGPADGCSDPTGLRCGSESRQPTLQKATHMLSSHGRTSTFPAATLTHGHTAGDAGRDEGRPVSICRTREGLQQQAGMPRGFHGETHPSLLGAVGANLQQAYCGVLKLIQTHVSGTSQLFVHSPLTQHSRSNHCSPRKQELFGMLQNYSACPGPPRRSFESRSVGTLSRQRPSPPPVPTNLTGDFPEYPEVEEGGSAIIFSNKTPQQVIEDIIAKQEEEERSAKKKKKEKEKEAPQRKAPKAAKEKTKEENEGWRRSPSAFLRAMEEGNNLYKDIWKDKDESWNFAQGHDPELIKEEKRKELESEIRLQVDELMRQELKNLKLAVNKEKENPVKAKKKGDKKKTGAKDKKGKKGKDKDLTADRTIESLYQELVEEGLLIQNPKVHLSDYIGEYCYLGTTLRRVAVEPMPSLQDVRQLITLYGILPLGSAAVHEKAPLVRSLLLAGPSGVGKKMLIHAICTETGANLFDLSATNIAGKYPGKSGVQMMLHLVFKLCARVLHSAPKQALADDLLLARAPLPRPPPASSHTLFHYCVARQLQPSVVWIGDTEKTFYRKVPVADRTLEPKRLKKQLPKALKLLKPDDRILIVGTTRRPFDAELQPFCKFYQKIILEIIQHNGGRLSSSLNVSCLAKVTDGFTPGHMVHVAQSVLTERRVRQQSHKPLTAGEFISALTSMEPVYQEEEDSFKSWYAKTPMGRRRALARTGGKAEREKEKGKEKGKKKAKPGKKKK
ncbi:LOW QUALITY PROTEIN: Dynein regulatory complex protein 11, partial [Galemys pyrenaicus]